MPETIWRISPPRSICEQSSLSEPLTFSQESTWPTRRLTLRKSVNSISATPSGVSPAAAAAFGHLVGAAGLQQPAGWPARHPARRSPWRCRSAGKSGHPCGRRSVPDKGQTAQADCQLVSAGSLDSERLPDFRRCCRHVRLDQDRHDADGFGQIEQDRGQAGRVFRVSGPVPRARSRRCTCCCGRRPSRSRLSAWLNCSLSMAAATRSGRAQAFGDQLVVELARLPLGTAARPGNISRSWPRSG